ncbi:6-carboxytetrahydropterin synthase, partial [Marinobacter sp.]|uniref:6-pyruvoyl trahydropterin synthase family protein n=1 Tax=Marinobacter sp. TaxID=50741 RepID=UPI002B4973D1
QKLHGATYVVDVSFERKTLDEDDLIVDIGLASEVLSAVLAEFNMQNLDELPELAGRNTTTEFMAATIFERMAKAIEEGRLGQTGKGLCGMKVTLGESHVAWASYHGEL